MLEAGFFANPLSDHLCQLHTPFESKTESRLKTQRDQCDSTELWNSTISGGEKDFK